MATLAELKACGCYVGFCRAETLLDAATRATMAGDEQQARNLADAYEKLIATCAGGWRAVPPQEERD